MKFIYLYINLPVAETYSDDLDEICVLEISLKCIIFQFFSRGATSLNAFITQITFHKNSRIIMEVVYSEDMRDIFFVRSQYNSHNYAIFPPREPLHKKMYHF